jgi:4'-phosphopantetheinyl transferase
VTVSWLPSTLLDADRLIRLIADFAGIPASRIRIVRACRSCGSTQHGKPQVMLQQADRQLHVNLSRSAGLAVVAVTDAGPIGIDIEATQPSAPEDLMAWVRMESLVKATGHGVTTDPDLLDDEPLWSVDLKAPDGFVAAVTILTHTPPTVTALPVAQEA